MNKLIFKGLPILMLLFLLIGLITGVATRYSYTDELAGQNPDLLPVDQEHEGYEPTDEDREVLLGSDLIARVVFEGQRVIEHEATRSTVLIREVIKGNGVRAGERIDVYEGSFLNTGINDEPVYDNYSCFNWMLEGKEYVIFVDEKDFHSAYAKSLERQVFVPESWNLGIFRSEFTLPRILSLQDIKADKVTYGDIKGEEFICLSEEQRTVINQFKKELFQAAGVES